MSRLNVAAVAALCAHEVKSGFVKIGFAAFGSMPEAHAERMRDTTAFYRSVARKAGVQPH